MDSPVINAMILGAVQGATEFLPVSSTAHLVVLPKMLGWSEPLMHSIPFNVALHAGTLLAVLAIFGRTWLGLIRDLRSPGSLRGRFALGLFVATLPAAACGAAFEGLISERLRSPLSVALWLSLGAAALIWADARGGKRGAARVTLREAFLIGCAQALALLPGLSRSGMTMTAGMALGLTRTEAARYSFILSVPIIAGACVWESRRIMELSAGEALPMLAGVCAAAVTGALSIKLLLAAVSRFSFRPFAAYRFLVAAAILLWIFAR